MVRSADADDCFCTRSTGSHRGRGLRPKLQPHNPHPRFSPCCAISGSQNLALPLLQASRKSLAMPEFLFSVQNPLFSKEEAEIKWGPQYSPPLRSIFTTPSEQAEALPILVFDPSSALITTRKPLLHFPPFYRQLPVCGAFASNDTSPTNPSQTMCPHVPLLAVLF